MHFISELVDFNTGTSAGGQNHDAQSAMSIVQKLAKCLRAPIHLGLAIDTVELMMQNLSYIDSQMHTKFPRLTSAVWRCTDMEQVPDPIDVSVKA